MKKFFTLFLIVLTFIFCINTQAELIVKTIFFKPTDTQHVGLDKIPNIVEGAQTLYADEMERQGFGRKTFKVERDVNRDIKVHTVNGRHQSWYYTNSTWDKVLPELPDRFNPSTPPWDKQDTVHIIIVGGVDSINGFWGQGWPHHSNRYGGNLLAAANSGHLNVSLIAHELGHCFGLYHKPEGSDPDPPSLEHYEARWLDKHYQFNNRGNDSTFPKLIGNPKLEAIGENEIKFTLSANGGSHGLHQCMVFRNSDILVVGWDYLNGKNMDTIEFRSPRWKWGSPITVELMDIRGNYTMKDFHVSIPDEIATNSDLVEGSHDANTKESSVNLTFNYGSSDSLVPINRLQEWDGWKQGVWEKTPNGIVSMKPPDYIKTTNMDAWDHWIYSHAPSRIIYAISDRNYTRFESYFDLPNSFCGGSASVRITVLVNDNMEIYDSGVLGISNRNMKISFTIPENTEMLTLEVSDLGNKNCDHFVFGSPKLYYATQPRIQETTKRHITDPSVEPIIDNDTGDPSNTVVSLLPMSLQSPNIGQLLKLSLKIANGKNVAGYQATVSFDTTALRYVSGTNGNFLSTGAFFVEPKVEGNLVKFNAASLAGESDGDGTLATLTFEVIAVKASTLTLSDILLSNRAGETFVPQVENAEITESTGLKEDINGDGTVNIADLVLVASNLGKTSQAADVNGDGVINIADLVLVAGALGNSASAPSLHPQVLEILTATDVKLWLSQAQQLDLTDTKAQRGILFLHQLLVAFTPKETALLPNYPNPFNPETWIPYQLAKDAEVTLTIYATDGYIVRRLALGHQPAGLYENRSRAAYWDGRNEFGERVASGVYFYTLTAGDFAATRRMLILK